MNWEERKKKAYDETVGLIADLGFRQRISFEEMSFLLNLLDMVFIQKIDREFISTLRKWMRSYCGSETDDIIKATLLAADFNDSESIMQCMQTVTELMDNRE
jgi:hypothetical protein